MDQIETTTVVGPNGESVTIPVPKIDTELVKKLTEQVDSLVKELKTKVYPVKLDSVDNLKGLIDFVDNHAPWKNMEALGIIEVSKVLHSGLEDGLKSGNIFMPSLS